MDIFGTCATVISLIQSAYNVYDGYKENVLILKEMEENVKTSQQLVSGISQKVFPLSTFFF